MTISNLSLYNEIMSFHIDEEKIDFTFSDRLARENQWSAKYSKKCILEYQKFIYLSSISDKNLTPSDQVDQAWHLHLTYTQSYWHNLCANILKKELHHGPTKGGLAELSKYKQQYRYTLSRYQDEFDEMPPRDIWPNLEKRFKNTDKFKRINTAEYWLIKSPVKLLIPVLFAPLIVMASTDDDAGYGLWFYIKLIIGVYVAYRVFKWLNRHNDGKGGSGCGSACGGCGGCGG